MLVIISHCFAFGMLMSVLLKLVPIFTKIISAWEVELPAVTLSLINICALTNRYWYLIVPIVPSELILIGILRFGGPRSRLAAELLNIVILAAVVTAIFFAFLFVTLPFAAAAAATR